jgi:hypothetical protein
MTCRALIAATAVFAATAIWTSPALAERGFIDIFIPAAGPTVITGASDTAGGVDPHIELVRGGAVIARSSGNPFFYATISVASVNAGDVVNAYRNNAQIASVTYDGLPTINPDACAGRTSFTGSRNAVSKLVEAGAFTPTVASNGDDTRSIFSQGNPFTVTLDRPLKVGQVAYAATDVTTVSSGNTLSFGVERQVNVIACPPAPPSPQPPAPLPAKSTTTTTSAPTDAQVLLAVKQALGATGAKLRTLDLAALAKRKSVALPFTFAEAGTAKLRLTAKVKRKTTVVGSASKTQSTAGAASIPLKLTPAGRALLKHARSIKLTLTCTFTPARAGAKPQSTSTSATLKRKKK